MSIAAITAIGSEAAGGVSPVRIDGGQVSPSGGLGFGDMLTQGMQHAESKVEAADNLVRRFVLDDSVPIHEVTIALEEARIAVDMALQVRSRLVEAYREIMNTQL